MTTTMEKAGPARAWELDGRRGLVMLCDVDFSYPDAMRTHTVEVARAFAVEGLDVDLVARGPDPRLAEFRYWAANGREPQRLQRLLTLNAVAITLLWRRRRTANRFYVRDNWSCLPAIVASRLLGYRVVTQVDGIPYGGMGEHGPALWDYIKRTVAVITGRLSTGVLAVTPQIKRLLVDLARVPAERITVIPNGVDLEFFRPIPRTEAVDRLRLDPNCRYIVFVGGFNPWSDFDTMLEAFSTVHAAEPEARLLLVGDGPERDHVERRARELGVRDLITITGMIAERERVRDYLAASTVALLAYREDMVQKTSASPIKLTEYLAAGRAVVAVDLPGVRELVGEPGAGVVIRGEPEAMSAAILGLLADGTADERGAAGRRVAEERLSWRSVIERTLPLFGD
jgi:glycosyltransferase involved in cell wall biosynthesis